MRPACRRRKRRESSATAALLPKRSPPRSEGRLRATSSHSSTACLPKADTRMTLSGSVLPMFRRRSIWELQFSLDRLEARLLAQRIHERVGLEVLEVRIAQPDRGVEP